MVLQGGGMARVKMSPHFAICCSERAENTWTGAGLEEDRPIVEKTWASCSRHSLQGKNKSPL